MTKQRVPVKLQRLVAERAFGRTPLIRSAKKPFRSFIRAATTGMSISPGVLIA